MVIANLRLGLLLATVVVSLQVVAAPRYWTLTGVQLEDGAVVTGYISYDDATGTIVNWNLRVSGGAGPFLARTIFPGNSHAWYPHTLYLYSYEPDLVPGFWWRSLLITPLVPLDGRSATVPIDVATSYDFFENDYDGGNPAFRVGPSRKFVAGSLVLSTSPAPAKAIGIHQHGLTGSWYSPAASGQGIQLEVYEDGIGPGVGYLHGSFATHDAGAQSGQRWYTFIGTVQTGQTVATLEIFQNTGGNFNVPPATESVRIGTMQLTFVDCDTAVIEYRDPWLDADGPYFAGWGLFTGTLPLRRLTPNITCSVDGASMVDVDFSYSGYWFDPETSGQGLFVELNRTSETSFMGWYTYATDGASLGIQGQRWYSLQGHFVPGARTLPLTVYQTTGTVIRDDWGSPVLVSETRTLGTATATFFDCHTARLTFTFTQGSNAVLSGETNLSRVGPAPAGCRP